MTVQTVADEGHFPPGLMLAVNQHSSTSTFWRMSEIGRRLIQDPILDGSSLPPCADWRRRFEQALEGALGEPGRNLLAGLTAWLLARMDNDIRQPAPELNQTRPVEVLRAARLWDLLRPTETELDGAECDSFGRWHPCDRNDENASTVRAWLTRFGPVESCPGLSAVKNVFQVLAAIDAASGPTHEVIFPAVYRGRGYLLRARVTLLRRGGENQLPRAVLAPWSMFLLDQEDRSTSEGVADWLSHLRGRLEDLAGADSWRSWLQDFCFLLELSPVSSEETSSVPPPPLLNVAGDSLGLAVALAAWAAHEDRQLADLVVTGAVDARGVLPVDKLSEKFTAAEVLGRSGGKQRFIYPATTPVPPHNPEWVEPCPVSEWDDLFQRKDQLLLDGLAPYLAATRQRPWSAPIAWDPRGREGADLDLDVQAYEDELGKQVIDFFEKQTRPANSIRGLTVMTMPFDERPVPTACFAVRRLSELLSQPRDLSTRRLGLVPLLFPLFGLEESGRTHVGSVQLQLLQGLREPEKLGEVELASTIRDGVLSNALRSPRRRLVLVAYSQRSTELTDYQTERKRLEALSRISTEVPGIWPGVLLVASDLHHERLARSVCPAS